MANCDCMSIFRLSSRQHQLFFYDKSILNQKGGIMPCYFVGKKFLGVVVKGHFVFKNTASVPRDHASFKSFLSEKNF